MLLPIEHRVSVRLKMFKWVHIIPTLALLQVSLFPIKAVHQPGHPTHSDLAVKGVHTAVVTACEVKTNTTSDNRHCDGVQCINDIRQKSEH